MGKCWGNLYLSGANNHNTDLYMASIRFKTYGKGVTNAPIYIRFSHGKTGIDKKTGKKYNGVEFEIKSRIIIPNSDYLLNNKTRRVAAFTNQQEIETKLRDLDSFVTKRLNDKTEYSKEWLQKIVDEFHGVIQVVNEEPTLLALIDKYCNHIINSAEEARQESTKRTYRVTYMRVTEFQKSVGKEYRLSEVDNQFKSDFISWARNIKNYRTSTFMKSIKQIQTVCRYAEDLKLKVDQLFIKRNKGKSVKNTKRLKPIYLSTYEINQLMTFEGSDYLTNARDWLVISCWTGCRVSDLMNLTLNNVIHTIKGEKAIRYTQKKTGISVDTPFHPDVERILNRNQGFPRPISDQKYNNYIKEVCKLVGFDEVIEGEKMNPITKRKESGKFPKYELIQSHIGRRSFATNNYGIFTVGELMLVTGHTTVKQFLEYVGENPISHVSVMNEYYRQNRQVSTPNTKTVVS